MKLQQLEKERLVVNRAIDVIEWELTTMGSNLKDILLKKKTLTDSLNNLYHRMDT